MIQDLARDSDENFRNPVKRFEEKTLGYPNPDISTQRYVKACRMESRIEIQLEFPYA
jgi:hypothetical protein